ncbi:TrkH family potassium uptake protein [Catellatospora coxensis]|uniref:TrkH family potassium uptake protein n=1 Tax=Catellatospora coxensis TaxID=310354 RepID=UPI001EF19464|nr:potassium transporter TrkG [Catellatospora coxensis]
MRRSVSTVVLDQFHHPTQVIVGGFAAAALAGTGLLSLPIATESGEPARFLDALFTATSAVCLTGLILVDSETHWSVAGELIIMLLIQAGGLGIMTMATLFAVALSGRMGLRARMLVQAETRTLQMTDLRRVVRNVVVLSLVSEAILAAVLAGRFMLAYGESFGRSVYLGLFHSISAFNNAGFALWPDSVVRFNTDPWICLTLAVGVIVGGLGFPVLFELRHSWRRPKRWSVLTRLTLTLSAVLLVGGTVLLLATEGRNPRTLGDMSGADQLLNAFFAAVMPRSGGFNSIDIAAMYPSSWLAYDALMFIGGGSAGTAGGIKVTTFGLLAYVIWAELRGEPSVNVGRRRIPEQLHRQALTIALVGVGIVAGSTYLLLVLNPHPLDQVLFEVISAFATVGVSTGITAELNSVSHALLAVLMFVGRVGPLTLGTALALRAKTRHYELPEERPLVG